MIRNSSREHHADHLGARRNRDPGQLLHGHEVREIVHHAAQVIHAVGVRNIGMPGLALAHLLRAAVMESDLGHGIDDLLAVELNHNPQDAVRARMLRAEVQKDEIAAITATLHAPLFGAEAQQFLFGLLLLFGKLERPHLRGARGVVLSQRMPCPTSGHQNALQVRMSGKRDSEHVPYFALVPVRRRPEVRDAVERQGAHRRRAVFIRIYSLRSKESRW